MSKRKSVMRARLAEFCADEGHRYLQSSPPYQERLFCERCGKRRRLVPA